MPDAHPRVKDRAAMIAGMSPVLDPEIYHFCTFPEAESVDAARALALGMFIEEEGLTLILRDQDARSFGCESDLPMQRITLNVFSALDGVGLTAAVAGELADHGIACNMVAAYHHDHAFVPAGDAQRAMDLLTHLAAR